MSGLDILKRAGLKATLPRLRVLTLFQESEQRHMSAEEVYRELLAKEVDIGLATVYRVLTQLEDAGLLKQAHLQSGRAFYELDDGRHHDHLVCLDCGHIREFFNNDVEQRKEKIAQSLGFELSDHTMVLYGSCSQPDCEARA
ncbi:ferric iron uptake transcriptional regulator [Alcaligenes endophyticus]|uniref:Ferric uptake regulation protein n=1 Tax=Alcaligenes endophyticus TaxID=1929088 RepID=A0ABT8EI62_9BURK|nr:ferric iron uptake transcriptional regulator [Alcaligenes endophyticus]MCX5592785.1 ferric iron uptake transcriptional regulator [Alcaligenes endophyticus]MDN4120973.1 ferric iron uptake transcriptional regulator [Alcaligenes endophyticus]